MSKAKLTDLLLIILFGVLSVPNVVMANEPFVVPLVIVVALLATIPLRRRYPFPAALGGIAVFAVHGSLPMNYTSVLVAADLVLPVLLFSVTVHGKRRDLWVSLAAAEVVFLAWALRLGTAAWLFFSLFTAIVVAAVAVGEAVASHRRRLADARDRAREAEEHRDALARAAVAEERSRIAREMHDIVAHAVTTMVMQSEGARLVGAKNPAAVDEALLAIGSTGREAVAELRRILGLLRESEAETEPQPGPDALGELANRMRAAGLEIRLVVEGDAADVPPGAAMTAHRIVQEALTNVVKHGPRDSRCTVTVHYGRPREQGRTLAIEVVNDGPPVAGRPGAGYGILGMRERASLYGGEVTTGPRPDGGFRVAARLRLTSTEPR
ncbi:sensor histidine kinase [Amycolatopsis sp. cg5]|uniref:sensor histidine kinase n=1 Tax=Amycolatopsis sp. cg5 TaxID=3238802 RepID=UPI003526A31A